MVGGDVAQLPRVAPAEMVHIGDPRGEDAGGGCALRPREPNRRLSRRAAGGHRAVPRFAALKLDGTRPFFSHLLAAIARSAAIASIVDGEPTATSVRLRHPSGVIVEVTPVPIDRAGASTLSVFSAGAFVDEGPRLIGEEDGVKNYDDFRRGVLGRMLPGAQLLTVGSPSAPYGPIFDLFAERFGKPGADLVVLRTRGAAANPTWWTTERLASLETRNPIAYRTDAIAEFADGEMTVFPASAMDGCFAPLSHSYQAHEPAIFCDPSQLRHDTSAAVVAGWLAPLDDDSGRTALG